MGGWKRGTGVVFVGPVRRGRRHKYGREHVRRRTRGVVVARHRHWRKGDRFDVAVPDGRYHRRVVRGVPPDRLSRRVTLHVDVIPVVVLTVVVLAVLAGRG